MQWARSLGRAQNFLENSGTRLTEMDQTSPFGLAEWWATARLSTVVTDRPTRERSSKVNSRNEDSPRVFGLEAAGSISRRRCIAAPIRYQKRVEFGECGRRRARRPRGT